MVVAELEKAEQEKTEQENTEQEKTEQEKKTKLPEIKDDHQPASSQSSSKIGRAHV